MTVKQLYNRFREKNSAYRRENLPIHCAAQIVVGLMLVHLRIQNGSLPEPIFLIGMLLFSILFWRLPTGDFWRNQLHLAAQSLIACLALAQDFLFIYLFLLLVGQAVLLFKIGPALIWIGAFVAIAAWGIYYHANAPLQPALRTVIVAVGFIFSGILSNRIAYERRAKKEIQQLLTEISDAHSRLRVYVEQNRFLNVVKEHNRLARELHRSLGHRLTVAIVQVEGANRLMESDPSQAGTMLNTVYTQLTTGLNELRDTLKTLSTPEINAHNLTPTLQKRINEFSRETGIVLHAQLTDMPDSLPETYCLTVYRAMQEGFANMKTHSQPTNIWVTLGAADDMLTLTMRHDGQEFDPAIGYGYGLPGMQERAFQLGGDLRVTKAAQNSVLMTFSLPIGETAR